MSALAPHRLVVIGGGVAGLQTLRALLRSGFTNVTLLEEAPDVGFGSSYKSLSMEVPWSAVQMPEFPLAKSNVHPSGPYPTPKEMQDYARAYAQEFGLFNCIKLNCKLVNLAPDARHRWVVSFTNTKERKHYQITASFVVLCTGIHTTPSIPVFPGAEDFHGTVVHSKDLKKVTDLAGKRVVLVGNGRAQSDMQAEIAVAQSAASVLLLNRKLHWPLPERMGPISTKRILASRWGTSLVSEPYYTASGFSRAMSVAGRPMKRAIWWALRESLDRRYKVTKANVTVERLHKDLHWGGHLSVQNWMALTQQGKVQSLKGRIRLMSPHGLVLDGGQEIACDLIVMCTGYSPSYRFMDPRVNLHLQAGSDGMYLYRHLIHPEVKNLAFVGSMVTSANHVLTTALQAEWLCKALQQHVKLPTAAAMVKDINAQRSWRRFSMAPQSTRAGLLMPYTQQYHDQLMKDMGERQCRKGYNLFREWFEPYSAADYASVFDPKLERKIFKVRIPHVAPPKCQAQSAALFGASSASTCHASGGVQPGPNIDTAAAVANIAADLRRQEEAHQQQQHQQAIEEESELALERKRTEQDKHQKKLCQKREEQKQAGFQQEQQQQQQQQQQQAAMQQQQAAMQQQQQQQQQQAATQQQHHQLEGSNGTQEDGQLLRPQQQPPEEHSQQKQQQLGEQEPRLLRHKDSNSVPLPTLKPARRSVVFDVGPLEGMEDDKPKEGLHRSLSKAVLEQLEANHKGPLGYSARPVATISRQNSAASFMTREVDSNALFGNFLDSSNPNSEWGGRACESATNSGRVSTLTNSMRSSVDNSSLRRFTSGNMDHLRRLSFRKAASLGYPRAADDSAIPDTHSSNFDIPSGRPSPIGRPSTTASFGMRSEWGQRDSEAASSKTFNDMYWEGGSNRYGSMRPSTGRPSTKWSDLMHASDASSKDLAASLGAQLTGVSSKFSQYNNGRASDSPHDSSVRSGSKLVHNIGNNILSDGEASSFNPSDPYGSAPSRRFYRRSMPSTVHSGDDRSCGASKDSSVLELLERPGAGLPIAMHRNSSAPMSLPIPKPAAHAPGDPHAAAAAGTAGTTGAAGGMPGCSIAAAAYGGGAAGAHSVAAHNPPANKQTGGMLHPMNRSVSGLSALEVTPTVSMPAQCELAAASKDAAPVGPAPSGPENTDSAPTSDVGFVSRGGYARVSVTDSLGRQSASRPLKGSPSFTRSSGAHQRAGKRGQGLACTGGDGSSSSSSSNNNNKELVGVLAGVPEAHAACPCTPAGDEEDSPVCIVFGSGANAREGRSQGVCNSVLASVKAAACGADGAGTPLVSDLGGPPQPADCFWAQGAIQSGGAAQSGPSAAAGAGEDGAATRGGTRLPHPHPPWAIGSANTSSKELPSSTFHVLSIRSSPLGPSAVTSFANTSQGFTSLFPSSNLPDALPTLSLPPTRTVSPFSLMQQTTVLNGPHSSDLSLCASYNTSLQSSRMVGSADGISLTLPQPPQPGPACTTPGLPPPQTTATAMPASGFTSPASPSIGAKAAPHVQAPSRPSSNQGSSTQLPSSPSSTLPSANASQTQLGYGHASQSQVPHLPSSPHSVSPRDGSATSGFTNSTSASYTNVVSNHMGVPGKKSGSRGIPGKHRSTLNDAAVLELLSAPPPIISSSRARSAKLQSPREDDEDQAETCERPTQAGNSPAVQPASQEGAHDLPSKEQLRLSLTDNRSTDQSIGLSSREDVHKRTVHTADAIIVFQKPHSQELALNARTSNSSKPLPKLHELVGEELGGFARASMGMQQQKGTTKEGLYTSASRRSSITQRLSALFIPGRHRSMAQTLSPKDAKHGLRQSCTQELARTSCSNIPDRLSAQHSVPLQRLGEGSRQNRRSSVVLGVLSRSHDRENTSGPLPLSARPSHPLANFLYRSAEAPPSPGNPGGGEDFCSSSSARRSSSGFFRKASPSATTTTAAAAQYVFQGIINEGLGQLIEHHEHQQQEAHTRQQQMAAQSTRVKNKKARNSRRMSLSAMLGLQHSDGNKPSVEGDQRARASIGKR